MASFHHADSRVDVQSAAEQCASESSKINIPSKFKLLHGKLNDLDDTSYFLEYLAHILTDENEARGINFTISEEKETIAARKLFKIDDDNDIIYVTRAPGRLDVMGGIADYSGSLVLQMPIKEACHVAIQRLKKSEKNNPEQIKNQNQDLLSTFDVNNSQSSNAMAPKITILSLGAISNERSFKYEFNTCELLDESANPISYESANRLFTADPSHGWAAYVAGCFVVLMHERKMKFDENVNMLISSLVPEGKGVSSSASLEVAVMSAIVSAYDVSISPRELAILCQMVENHVVQSPCGVMDQIASCCGEKNKLLALVCQPAEIQPMVQIPPRVKFWALDSGIRHSVSGSDYSSVRAAAFMGKKIINASINKQNENNINNNSNDGNNNNYSNEDVKNEIEGNMCYKERSVDYLCSLSPYRYESLYSKFIPQTMKGDEFLKKFLSHDDTVTNIENDKNYFVFSATVHPIYENFRVSIFSSLLNLTEEEKNLKLLGELMYQSHESYSRCGLHSFGTNLIVNLVQNMNYTNQIFGAKITGGGCGGTVCIFGKNDEKSEKIIKNIQKRYFEITNHFPFLFEGSSPGASQFGHLKLKVLN